MSSHQQDSQQRQQRQRFNTRSGTNNGNQFPSRYPGEPQRSSTYPQMPPSQLVKRQNQQELESNDGTNDQISSSDFHEFNSHTHSRIKYAEELDKTEQSITLALQEIDRNFAQAQRIVASAIVPVVERYGQESRKVWAGARFWKGFLEASANVSLTGYEEIAANEGVFEETAQQQEQQAADEGVAVQYNDEDSEIVGSYVAEQHKHDSSNKVEASTNHSNHNGDADTRIGEEVGENDVVKTQINVDSASRHKDDSSMLPDPPSTLLFASKSHQQPRHKTNTPNAGVFKQPAPPHARLEFGSTTPTDSGATAATTAPGRDDTVSSVASSPFNSNILPHDESPSFAGVSGATPAGYNNRNTNYGNNDSNLSPVLMRHKILDTTWRIEKTPHKKPLPAVNLYTSSVAATIRTPHRIRGFREQIEAKKQSFAARFDSSPLDQLEPPQLQFDLSSPTPRKKQHTEEGGSAPDAVSAIFATPKRRGAKAGLGGDNTVTVTGPKTPIQRFYDEAAAVGDSSFESEDGAVLTPSNPARAASTTAHAATNITTPSMNNDVNNPTAYAPNTTFQDDDTSITGLLEGMSPPVTMQFTMPTRVLQRTQVDETAQTILKDTLDNNGTEGDADGLDPEQP